MLVLVSVVEKDFKPRWPLTMPLLRCLALLVCLLVYLCINSCHFVSLVN